MSLAANGSLEPNSDLTRRRSLSGELDDQAGTHDDLTHLAAMDAARLLDEVAQQRGAWRKRHMADLTVQELAHSENGLRQAVNSQILQASLRRLYVEMRSDPTCAQAMPAEWPYATGR
jgi:hypothetical protein